MSQILHYLETVRPHQLLEQMVCTAFRGSADTLNLTNFGDMKQMTSKLEQLYLIIRSTLGVLQRKILLNFSCGPIVSIMTDIRMQATMFQIEKRRSKI